MLQRRSASPWAVLAVMFLAMSARVLRANAQTYSSGIVSTGVPINPMPPNAPVLVCNPDVSAPSNIDGTCNNLQCPLCGIRQTPFRRFLPDAVYVPFDPFRQPNERFISNVAHQIGKDEDGQKDERNIGDFTYQFGQFVNHDMQDANNPGPNPIAANIVVPKDDDGNMTGVVFFNRAATTAPDKLGRRFPLNGETTQYLDASVVYGSTVDVGNALRAFKFGLLATQQRNGTIPKNGPGKNHVPPPSNDPNDPLLSFPPFQTRDFIFMGNPNNRDPTTLIIAGDSRANEQAGLLAQHVLWMRNHNFWARRFAAVNPFWSDEQLFQAARRMNRAEFQKIAFYDLVRVTLGKKAFARLGPYPGYNPNVGVESTDAMVCAGMRHGHSMVGLFLERNFFRFDPLTGQQQFDQDNFGRVSDSFFVPEIVLDTVDGIDSWMLGAARSSSSRVDHSMVDPLRNMLFPGFHNDLIAIDNRRCRDFGLSSWVVTRRSLGLDVPKDFNDLKKFVQRDRDVNNLKLLYRRVEDIDLFTGGVVEKHADGSSISALFVEFWIDRFARVRAADRFWFENPGVFDSDPKVDAALRALVWKSTLKSVILRNTRLRRESLEVGQDDLFFGPFPPQRDPAAQRDNNDPFQVDLFPPNNQRQAAGDLIPDDEDDEDGIQS